MASVQLLQVVNTSVNFPIYWFVGNFRETFLNLFCGSQGVMGRVRKTLFNSDSDINCHEETNIEMMSRQSSVPTLFTNSADTGFAYEKLLKTVKTWINFEYLKLEISVKHTAMYLLKNDYQNFISLAFNNYMNPEIHNSLNFKLELKCDV